LFRALVKRGKLKHPTSASFDPRAWVTAAAGIDPLTFRDASPLTAAIYFGEQISSLRTHIQQHLIAPYSRESGARLLASIANEQFMTVHRKSMRLGRRSRRDQDGVHLETIMRDPIRSAHGHGLMRTSISRSSSTLSHTGSIISGKSIPEPRRRHS
jgi:hypothetical protein